MCGGGALHLRQFHRRHDARNGNHASDHGEIDTGPILLQQLFPLLTLGLRQRLNELAHRVAEFFPFVVVQVPMCAVARKLGNLEQQRGAAFVGAADLHAVAAAEPERTQANGFW